ncbi:LysR family transcriptional regulator [uncultured Roseovarius sp.]|uniref:LysR family transcriptional regulator n=1 Tax=uncultured Roseovarius sp. TaxID=293344 RepID=UPI002606E1DA|nr:LysR family transcriptional regulator [uncultured Roseovarius sp.]
MNSATSPESQKEILLQNWDLYRYFLSVARVGSVSEAAKQLGESQPTISRKLKDLETSLGVQLVERTTAGTTMTAAGELVLNHIQNIEREAIGMSQALREDGQQMSGKVVVAAPEGLGVTIIARSLPKFRVLHPGIDLELRIGASKLDLIQRDADIAIRIGDPLQASVLGRRINTVTFGLYAQKRYFKQNPIPRTIDNLRDHQFVELTVGRGKLPQEIELERLLPVPRRVLRTDNMQVLLNAVRDGIGIGALPSYMISPAMNLHHIFPQKFAPKAELWILMRRELRDVARMRATVSFLTNVVKQATSP